MRIVKEQDSMDAVADPNDVVQVELQEQPMGKVLYVHVNGRTVLRIGWIRTNVDFDYPEKQTEIDEAYNRGVRSALSHEQGG